jgi:hypothetical protein
MLASVDRPDSNKKERKRKGQRSDKDSKLVAKLPNAVRRVPSQKTNRNTKQEERTNMAGKNK